MESYDQKNILNIIYNISQFTMKIRLISIHSFYNPDNQNISEYISKIYNKKKSSHHWIYIFYRRNISCCAAPITLYQYEVRSVVDIRRNELIYIIDWYHGDLIYFIVVTVDVICFPFWHFPYFLLYREFVGFFFFGIC